MDERDYIVTVHSIWRFIASIVIILCGLSILINKFLPGTEEHPIVFLLQVISTLGIAFFLAQKLGMGKVKIRINDKGFTHIWERRFLLSWEKSVIIPWGKIIDYGFVKDRAFDSFIINLPFKHRYRIYRLNMIPLEDDFNLLLSDFPKLSNRYKKQSAGNNYNPIELSKSIYEQTFFKWIVYLFACIVMILLIIKILNPETGSPWASLGIMGSAAFFYIAMIIANSKKMKS